MPIQQFFSYFMARTSKFSTRWWWGETTIRREMCCPTRTHYPDSEPTSLCSYSLILHT